MIFPCHVKMLTGAMIYILLLAIGPYMFYATRLENCPLPTEAYWAYDMRVSHFNPKRPNQLQILNGTLTGRFYNVSDETWVKAVLDVRSNNEWKPNAFVFHFRKKACSSLRALYPNFMFLMFGDALNKSQCVVYPGVYTVNEKPIDWTFPIAPILPYGHYRFRITLGEPNANPYGCFIAAGYAIPKVS